MSVTEPEQLTSGTSRQNVLHSSVFFAFPVFSTHLFITTLELKYQMDPRFNAARQMALRDKDNYCWLSVKVATAETYCSSGEELQGMQMEILALP